MKRIRMDGNRPYILVGKREQRWYLEDIGAITQRARMSYLEDLVKIGYRAEPKHGGYFNDFSITKEQYEQIQEYFLGRYKMNGADDEG